LTTNTSDGETGQVKRTSLQPARSYALPGGPYAKFLGDIDVYVLAEIERGGENDRNRSRG
jgi:hypothetical protein